jgi:lysyl-tRNA synthetase class 2
MEDSEALIVHIADRLGRGRALTFGRNTISLETPWERLQVAEAFLRYGRVAMVRALSEDRFDEIMVNRIESHLGRKKPTFLYDYPASLASLSRLKPEDPSLAERFELFIGGVEIANGFSELTDAFEQRARFEKEREESRQSAKPIYPMPEPFLEDLHDMPDAAGAAMGLDRLVMVFSDCRTIDDVVPFSPEDL